MPDLPAILDAIQAEPASRARWLALSSWLWNNGRTDEATAVRVFWPTLRDLMAVNGSVHATMREVARDAAELGRRGRRALGRRARRVEQTEGRSEGEG